VIDESDLQYENSVIQEFQHFVELWLF
jgi:hypothetical protein